MYALNFYSPMVADQLRSRRKTATIRLGDKSQKYKKGMIVQVLAGARYSPRQKIFEAVIDKVEVKRLAELSPRDIEHDNPEIRRPGLRIGVPKAEGGRSSPPQDSHSTAKADENRASHAGQRERIFPWHCGHAFGSSPSDSSK